MAEILNPGGGGSTEICNVSPSDQAGQINNILDRLTNCEIAIAKLAGLDVSATNASDMVASLGTITNGTIIMPDNSVSGWTNSIPPGDFTGSIISNGVITTWTDGVVSFEVLSTGGGGVTVGGGGGGLTDVASLYWNSHDVADFSTYVNFDGVQFNVGSSFSWSAGAPEKLTIQETGTYLFNTSQTAGLKATFSETTRGFTMQGAGGASWTIGSQVLADKISGTGTSKTSYYTCSYIAQMTASDYVRIVPRLFTPDTTTGKLQGLRLF